MDGEKKKRKGRRAYLNDFQQDASGRYVYRGSLYAYGGRLPRRRFLAALWLLCGGGMAAVLAAGVLPAPGMDGSAYVLLPYAGGLVSGVSVLWTVGNLAAGGDPLREYVYEIVRRLNVRLVVAAAFSAAAAAGQLAALFLAAGSLAAGAASLLLLAAAAGSFFIGRRIFLAAGWIKQEK